MKRFFIFIIVFNWFTTIGQTPTTDPTYQLVFDDEFIGNSIDVTKWKVLDQDDHFGQEYPLVYRSMNVSQSGGLLQLKLQKELFFQCDCSAGFCTPYTCAYQNSHPSAAYSFSGAWVELQQQHYIQYGYIEASIKLPQNVSTHGVFPAFWTLIGDHITPHDPNLSANEIDIFEMPGNRPGNMVYTNVHLNYPCNGCTTSSSCPLDDVEGDYSAYGIPCRGLGIQIPSWDDGNFHTWGLEWSPTRIKWYYDGVVIRNYVNPGVVDPVKLILDLKVNTDTPPPSAYLPQSMLFDYVRIYQLNADCDIVNTCNLDFTTYNNKVKKSIDIGGTGCVNATTSGSSVYLWASDYITLKGDFSVPIGADFFANADDLCDLQINPNVYCASSVSACSTSDFLTLNSLYLTRKEIDIGGTGCNVAIAPLPFENQLIHATDKIILKNGTHVGANSSNFVELKITTCH